MSNLSEQQALQGEEVGHYENLDCNVTRNILVASSVLVIDDEQMNIEIMNELLKQQGVKNDSAISGQLGLKLIEERIALVEKGQAEMYKLILLDYSMPEMDGP